MVLICVELNWHLSCFETGIEAERSYISNPIIFPTIQQCNIAQPTKKRVRKKIIYIFFWYATHVVHIYYVTPL